MNTASRWLFHRRVLWTSTVSPSLLNPRDPQVRGHIVVAQPGRLLAIFHGKLQVEQRLEGQNWLRTE